MTARTLWQNIMNYGSFDRMPVIHWGTWPETRERWISEGLPGDVEEHQYFNAFPQWTTLGPEVGLFPVFEEITLEESDGWRIFRDNTGVIQKAWKGKSCIPHYIEFTLKTSKDWPIYQKHLQPDPRRVPVDFVQRIADAEASGLPIALFGGSLMGWIRNWMGVENMSYLIYDDPGVYAEMVDTLAELACWAIDQTVPKMKSPPDMIHLWEDICGKNGPLISPDAFEKYIARGYQKICRKANRYGIPFVSIDSDGDVSDFVELWLDAGVNIQVPLEIGTWNADPGDYRKKYGKELRIMGGLNKLELEKGPAAIDAEIQKRIPLMKQGGFVVMPDHLITPATSLKNYKYYLDQIRCLRL